MQEAVATLKATAEEVQLVARTVNRIGTQIENAHIFESIANGLEMLPDLFNEFQRTLSQTQKTLKGFEQFSASLEGLGKEFDGIGVTIRKAVENASVAIENANVAIENIVEITEPVSQNSEQLVANVMKAFAEIDTLASELRRLSVRINNSNGTVAQLIDNPALFIEVNKTLSNIKSASANIQILTQKAQPIVSDFRVFSDKIARNPGQLIDLGGTIRGRLRGVGTK